LVIAFSTLFIYHYQADLHAHKGTDTLNS